MAKNIFPALNIQPKQTTSKQNSNTFVNNYRNFVSGPQAWDSEMISEALEDRWAGLDESENPLLSFNVNIPSTQTVRNIQSGRYKLNNNTNLTGLNNDAALYIVGNTYQENGDGTHYGMGWDGRPYSYTIKNNIVGDFTPLGADEHKNAINKLSNGNISVDESITNPATLAQIARSIKRAQNYGNGNLAPSRVTIRDPFPKMLGDPENRDIGGITYYAKGTADDPMLIEIMGSNFPLTNARKAQFSKELDFHPAAVDIVPQHELAHAIENSVFNIPSNYYYKIAEDAKKYSGKYTIGDLFDDAISKIKYAVPVLSDAIFGTHLVPNEEDVETMLRSKNPTLVDFADYWYDYFQSPGDKFKYKTVENQKLDAAENKVREWKQKYLNENEFSMSNKLFEKAAKNTGFDSVDDAVESISEYATTNSNEAFAEAYSDVLLNGNNAKDFSKELIRLYSELADDATKTFGKEKPTQLTLFQNLIEVLPKDAIKDPRAQLNKFQNNYRTFYSNK